MDIYKKLLYSLDNFTYFLLQKHDFVDKTNHLDCIRNQRTDFCTFETKCAEDQRGA